MLHPLDEVKHSEGCGDIYNKTDGESDGKFFVLCFVPECEHTQNSAHSTAEQGNEDKRPLGNPPQTFRCRVFIDRHKYEKHCGEKKQIDDKKLFYKFHATIPCSLYYEFLNKVRRRLIGAHGEYNVEAMLFGQFFEVVQNIL